MTTSVTDALSFSPPNLLIKRFCVEHNVTETEAIERFEETKKFLILAATKRTKVYSPSKPIDEMWHAFLINSKHYFEFCNKLGCFIHHQPSENPQPENYNQTRSDLESMFGTLNLTYWSKDVADCDGGSSCDCCPYF